MSYKLDHIVREQLVEQGDSNFNRYARFLQYAISGLREFNMDFSGNIKAVIVDVNDNNTVTLPTDYINYTRIGIIGNNGIIRDLGINTNLLAPITYDDCGNSFIPTSNETLVSNSIIGSGGLAYDGYSGNYRNGELMGRFFGIGGGNNVNGYYNVKASDGYIVLGGVQATQIVLEYISDITEVNGEFEVHPFLIEALKSYMFWKSIKNDFTKNLGEKNMARNDFYTQKRQAVRRFNSSTTNEWIQTFRSGNMAAPKF